jgi:hypothetical protein
MGEVRTVPRHITREAFYAKYGKPLSTSPLKGQPGVVCSSYLMTGQPGDGKMTWDICFRGSNLMSIASHQGRR